ncbi:MAG: transglutaminase domain-containing protein [Termitinemataceae bacterium]|nr:MAG: transglutaminase domain-containing protein [Termitinemataceae bacterium]
MKTDFCAGLFFKGALVIIIPFFASCAADKPTINSLDPSLGDVGSLLTIHGKNFGNTQDESFVSIGGVHPTRSSYYSWSDDTIVVQVPDFGESGTLFVNCKNKKSNTMLFATTSTIPKITETSYTGPFITSLKNDNAKIGTTITINGNGFGDYKKDDKIIFTLAAEQRNYGLGYEEQFISSSEINGNIKSWSGHEITVYVSDGAESGNIRVETDGIQSNVFSFNVNTANGKKLLRNKKTYTLEYSVDVKVDKASLPNAIYLWLPQPVTYSSQVKKELLSCNVEALMEDHKGTALFRLENFKNGSGKNIAASYLVDVYEVTTNVEQSFINQQFATKEDFAKSEFVKKWTLPSPLVESDSKKITELNDSIKSDRNPYSKANAIYNYILKNTDTSDSYSSSILFCALARNSGIACLPIFGVLTAENTTVTPHTWAIFWLDGIGWLPVDVSLGGEYNFGNLNNSHIAFRIGDIKLSQISTDGYTSSAGGNYARMNIWEEAGKTIESYSTHWGDVTITGVYSN